MRWWPAAARESHQCYFPLLGDCIGDLVERAAHRLLLLGLRLDPVAHDLLLVAHVLDEAGMPSARLAMAVATRWLEPPVSCSVLQAARTSALQLVGCDRCWHASTHAMSEDRSVTRRQPVFQLGVETVLRAAGLQVEKADDQRAGKAEQRRREGRAHAGQRRRKPAFSASSTSPASPEPRVERLDGLADRADRAEQTPERAEQAEKDQQAGEVAR